jgi:hypothetical protein
MLFIGVPVAVFIHVVTDGIIRVSLLFGNITDLSHNFGTATAESFGHCIQACLVEVPQHQPVAETTGCASNQNYLVVKAIALHLSLLLSGIFAVEPESGYSCGNATI